MKKIIKNKKQLSVAVFGFALVVALAAFNISLSVTDTGLSKLRATTLQALSDTYIWGVTGCENSMEKYGYTWYVTVCNSYTCMDKTTGIVYPCGFSSSSTCTFTNEY